tara:strand:- start:7 stop:228 length:222 start_codon:yes stop_codon:yes gene_type:complete
MELSARYEVLRWTTTLPMSSALAYFLHVECHVLSSTLSQDQIAVDGRKISFRLPPTEISPKLTFLRKISRGLS